MSDYLLYQLGAFGLASGETLLDATLAYETHGELNSRRDNAVLLLTWYTGTHRTYRQIIGAGRALDPAHHFIIVVNMFGNGLSSSPSNSQHQPGPRFPLVSVGDNVRAQHQLVTAHLGIDRLALVCGWSMGAMQAWHWAAAYAPMVGALLPICGSARCWPLNTVFLAGIKAVLQADPAFDQGYYRTPPLSGLAAFARVYAGWAYCATFYREQRYRTLGFDSIEALLCAWERDHQAWDANDLLCMLSTWQQADIGLAPPFAGDLDAALGAITATTIVMPCNTDLYFTQDEALMEFRYLKQAQWRPIISPYGHCAGAPGRFPDETAFIEQAIRELLSGDDASSGRSGRQDGGVK
ncbi:alpha/beta fold hydrolase [Acerihabitans sp. TG2]|uniref:alpha/beta fold hydrolase n=1 Tax=Acerihabitans sp. TG2 TaxID=3096008 RepID=UPI002B225979|nr:alpha/beta fold hydrolase [Acerihabitans sp. TG2]MEA9391403.1 alpha/beta fold hydrolase [Acerihabitans sp. TG2]